MELLEIYDAAGHPTGKTAQRGTPLPEGYYFLCAHVLLEDIHGRFLIQRRSDTKPTRPGQWDITAGAVDPGETSLDGALREAWEEVGLRLPREQMTFLFRDRRRSCFHDVYHICLPFTLADCTMQPSEVQALRLVSAQELATLIQGMAHRSDHYKEEVTHFLQNK